MLFARLNQPHIFPVVKCHDVCTASFEHWLDQSESYINYMQFDEYHHDIFSFSNHYS